MVKIVSFDPGFTTGWAIGELTGPRDFKLLEVGELLWDERFNARALLAATGPGVVVMEDFRLYAHKAESQIDSPFPSARVIGVVDAFCWELSIPVAMQPASVLKNVEILDHDKPKVGASPHQQDAYAHLRYYVLLNGHKICYNPTSINVKQ